MQKNYIQTIQQYARDQDSAQALGAALLQCNGMLVLEIAPHLSLFIPNFQIPVITHNEAADYNLAGGGQFHTSGAPKNRYETTLQFIETDLGTLTQLSELLMATDGMTNAIAYEGRIGRYIEAHEFRDCAITFDMKEVEGDGVSTIMRVQAQMKLNYYGVNAQLGSSGEIGRIKNALGGKAAGGMIQQAREILALAESGSSLYQAIKGYF